MRTTCTISAIALAAALLAPQAAQAQLNLGVDLGGNGSGGLGLGVDANIGDTNIGVDAGVGGDSLVDVDAGISSGGSERSGGNNVLDVDLGVGGSNGLVDLDVDVLNTDLSGGTPSSGAVSTPTQSVEPVGVRLSALNQAVRLEALVGQINVPNLAAVDLDDIIDDRAVSIVAVADLLGEDNLAEINALVGAGGTGRDELLNAINASVELGSILEREGIAADDVLSVSVGANGATELLVLDVGGDLAQPGEGSLIDNDLADLDIDLLTDEELAEIDLALLPNQEQRLDAIIRILGNDSGADEPGDTASGPISIIDVDALLDEASLAELDVVLNAEDGSDVLISAELLEALQEQGLDADAVIAIGNGPGGSTQVLVNAGLGDTELSDVAVTIGGGNSDSGGDTGGNGNEPGDNTGGTDGDGTGNGGTDNDGETTGNGGTGSVVDGNGALTSGLPSAMMEVNAVVAEVSCEAGMAALSAGQAIAPADVNSARNVELVRIEGCVQTLSQQQVDALRSAVGANAVLRSRINQAGLDLGTLIGGNVEGQTLTLYFDVAEAA